MKRIKEALIAVFEDFDESMFNDNLMLGDIPGWDSMNSINFQMALESIFNIDLSENGIHSDIMFEEKHKITDVINILKSIGVSI